MAPRGERHAARLSGVAVALTTACNLRCSYCYQRRGAVRRMSWDVLRAVCDLLLRGGAPEPRLGLLGGEPLLALPLIRRTAAYLDERAPPGVRAVLAVTTNGTLIDEEALSFLAVRRVRTAISFDGVEPAQRLRGPGTFATLAALLERLRDDYPGWFEDDVTVGITLSAANLDHLAESVRYFLAESVSTLAVEPLFTCDPDWNDGRVAELDRQLAEVYATCRDEYRRTGKVPFEPFRGLTWRRSWRRSEVPMCRIGEGRGFFVDVDGEATACGAFARSFATLPTEQARRAAALAHLGPVTSPDILDRLRFCGRELRALELFGRKEQKRSRYKRCADCDVLHECLVCPLSIANQPGNEDHDAIPPLPCAFNLHVGKYRRRFRRFVRSVGSSLP